MDIDQYLEVKQFFLGKGFELLEPLGKGSMGVVYKAISLSDKSVVAIKFLSPKLRKRKNFKSTFFKEMALAKSLIHPNIVQTFSFDYIPKIEAYYGILEYIQGKSLYQILQKKPRFPIPLALKILIKVLRALCYSHEKNLVHRNLSPHNILISEKGEVKVNDFGLSQVNSYEESSHAYNPELDTRKPYYMAPELAFSKDKIDIRADIYSLGIVFFHMLVGRPPFVFDNPLRIITAHCYNPIPSLSDFREDISKEVKSAFKKMVLKDREMRFKTPSEVLLVFQEIQKKENLPPKFPKPSPSENLARPERRREKYTTQMLGKFTKEDIQGYQSIEEYPTQINRAIPPQEGSPDFVKALKRRLLTLGSRLVERKKITSEQLAEFLDQGDFSSIKNLPQAFVQYKIASPEEIAGILAKEYHLPFLYPDQVPLSPEMLQKIPVQLLTRYHVMPVQIKGDQLLLAVEDPVLATIAQEEIQGLTKLKVRLAIATKYSIEKAIEQNYGIQKEKKNLPLEKSSFVIPPGVMSIQSSLELDETRQSINQENLLTPIKEAIQKMKLDLGTLEKAFQKLESAKKSSFSCPNCQKQIQQDFISCPFCQAPTKNLCGGCNKILQVEWTICPYCNRPKNRS